MALSTISSLDESFTTGMSLVADENVQHSESQDIAMEDSAVHATTRSDIQRKGTITEGGDTVMEDDGEKRAAGNVNGALDTHEMPSTEASVSNPADGDESESGSDGEDTILQVHD